MTQTGFCTRCGAGLVEGNCPACLLQLGLSGALPAVLPRRSRRWIPAVLVAIGIATLLALLFLRAPRVSPRRQMLQLSILPPPQTEIGALAVAPDGHAVVFAGISPDRET